MAKDAMFTMKLEAALRESFMAEAAATDRPASQIVREFMRDFVDRGRAARDHDAWFRGEVERALGEAADPTVERVSGHQIEEDWRRRRARLVKMAGDKTG